MERVKTLPTPNTLQKTDLSCQPSKPRPALYSVVYITLTCKNPYTEIQKCRNFCTEMQKFLTRKKHEYRGVCKSVWGTREWGCKEWPLLIALDMINGFETGKLWGMFCFHRIHSMADSPAEALQAATGERQQVHCGISLAVRRLVLLASYPKWERRQMQQYHPRFTVDNLPKFKGKSSIPVTPEI